MIADRVRMDAYRKALEHTVQAGSTVVDIGTGTGIFALLACKLGARRVYAIEPAEAIQVAREIAVANGFSGRIEFIQKTSDKVELPERADVIVSDMRGVLPLLQNHLPAIVDARQRFLAPGGVLIPGEDRLWASVIESPEAYRRCLGVWETNEYGLDMRAARSLVVNAFCRERFTREQMVTPAKCWATLDYYQLTGPNVAGEASWTIEREVEAHGLAVWFDTTLVTGIGFTTGPGSEKTVYGDVFLPWEQPVNLRAGDTVDVVLRADLVAGDYVWQWNTTVREQGEPVKTKVRFRQSTFFGHVLSSAGLQKGQAGYRPKLVLSGEIDRFILGMMDGERTNEQIAREAAARFPGEFTNWKAALGHVGTLALRYDA